MLQIKNFTKIYPDHKVAVNDITLSIDPGDIFGFIGSNGAGKTTTLKAVVGIHDFDAGSIEINGHSIKKEPLLCKKLMAYLPDQPDLYEHLSGMGYIHFIADLYQVTEKERKERINRYGDLFDMTPHLGNVIASYSHGMKQKTALIAGLVHSPKLLILDEPFVGLDPKSTFLLKQLMKEFVALGNAIFFSTHILEVAEKLCNKIAVIKQGQLIAGGVTKEILGNQSLESFFMEVQEQ